MVRALLDEFPQARWLLALRGDVPEDLRRHPAVALCQEVPYERLPLLYNAADFLISTSRYEPFGYVVAEALACGTPVVASPGGASRLFLDGEPLRQFLVGDAQDVAGFRRAIALLLADAPRYRRIVIDEVRPQLEELLGPENWWRRFLEVTGL